MRVRGLLVAAAAAALVAPAARAADVQRPPVTWVRGEGSYTKASRKPEAIRCIVVHVTEGGLHGSVYVLTGARSHASAHYVVNRDGRIMQLVHQSDIAWHAGNARINGESIGIEHVGMTYDPGGFPRAEYVASAKLAAWTARRSLMPVDRAHIIGHAEVPDPADPTRRGGADHHTDPGPHWNWKLYLRLVRSYAFPPAPLKIASSSLRGGQSVKGIVRWRVATKGPKARRVDFLVDGRVVWQDGGAPYSFGGRRGWNSTHYENGAHVLEARAIGPDGKVARLRVPVRVHNPRFAVTTSRLQDWQRVRGGVTVAATVRGAASTGIWLYVDGRLVSRDRRPPYRLAWDTHGVRNGRHVLTVVAEAADGRVARRRVTVVVSNPKPRPKRKPPPHSRPAPPAAPKPKPAPAPKPAPKPVPKPEPKPRPAPAPTPKPPPAVTWQSLTDAQNVQGTVEWQALTTGPVGRVEFVVDGTVRATVSTSPWLFAWDTSVEAPGAHAVTVRAVAADGRTAEATASVTVVAPPTDVEPPPGEP